MRPKVLPAMDPVMHTIIHGTLAIDAAGTIRIRIPMKLEGTNAGMWGGHWSKKRAATAEWETRLKFVMCDYGQCDTVSGFYPDYLRAIGLPPVKCAHPNPKHRCDPTSVLCRTTRRVIQVRRLAPSRRNFTRDDDHTPMAQKPLIDAIKRLGFIRDDSRNWVELKPLVQEVSPDGKWWTEIEVSVPVTAAPAAQSKASPR